MSRTETHDIVTRLQRLLHSLTDEYQSTNDLLHDLIDLYDAPQTDSMRRTFRRDITSLRALGFIIQRSGSANHATWRVVGHARWAQPQ